MHMPLPDTTILFGCSIFTFIVLMFSCIFHRKLQSGLALASVRVLVFYVCCTQSSRFVLFGQKRGGVTDVGQICKDIRVG